MENKLAVCHRNFLSVPLPCVIEIFVCTIAVCHRNFCLNGDVSSLIIEIVKRVFTVSQKMMTHREDILKKDDASCVVTYYRNSETCLHPFSKNDDAA